MLYLLSPAKTLNYEATIDDAVWSMATRPGFVSEATELIELLRMQGEGGVARLMSLSPALATLNAQRYDAWRPRFTRHNSRPAVLAFDGEVYAGLDARQLDLDGLVWAQQHLAILSGLYGVLRPMDMMQPYRLEMGTRLASALAKDLYGFWGSRLSVHLDRRLRGQQSRVIVNLASQEYARAVDRRQLKGRIIDCVFEDWSDDGYKTIGFFAKRARGLMARFAIDQRIEAPEQLRGFDRAGYRLAADDSTPDRLVFRRQMPGSPDSPDLPDLPESAV